MPRNLADRESHLDAFREHAERRVERNSDWPPRGLPTRWRLDAWRDDPRVGAVVLILVAAAAGLIWYRTALGQQTAGSEAAATATTVPAPTTSTTMPSEVVVHVSGAVHRPGVYELPGSARVADAVEKAGGALDEAELHRLNLAARVADGQQIHVPLPGEPVAPGSPVGVSSPSETGASPAVALVNVNLATLAELEALPGVGPAIAQAIVDERERRGGFGSVDDLLSVKGIGEQRLEDLRPHVTI